jgi:hypothetical protein
LLTRKNFIRIQFFNLQTAECAISPSVHFSDPVSDSIPGPELQENKGTDGLGDGGEGRRRRRRRRRRRNLTEKKTLRSI